jgi:hypothetical protein
MQTVIITNKDTICQVIQVLNFTISDRGCPVKFNPGYSFYPRDGDLQPESIPPARALFLPEISLRSTFILVSG